MCKQCEPRLLELWELPFRSKRDGRRCFIDIGICAESLVYLSWTCDGRGNPTDAPFASGDGGFHNLAIIPYADEEGLASISITTTALNKRVRDTRGHSSWKHACQIQTGHFYAVVLEWAHTRISKANGLTDGSSETLTSDPSTALLISLS
jgi:hypothetical protein